MGPAASIRAWRPAVAGVAEVLHAHFPSHAYPSHTHDTWTILLVDDGVVRFDLDRHELGAVPRLVTLLPPGVPHDGRSVTAGGFRKRVVYLEQDVIGADRIGAAVDRTQRAHCPAPPPRLARPGPGGGGRPAAPGSGAAGRRVRGRVGPGRAG